MDEQPYQALLTVLRDDPRVRLVYAFGSAARGGVGARSDVDLGIWFGRKLAAEEERRLRAALAAVDARADLVILDGAPPVLRYEVVTGGRCLLARDAAEQAEFEITGLSRFLDFQPMRRVQQEYLRARVEERRGSAARSAP